MNFNKKVVLAVLLIGIALMLLYLTVRHSGPGRFEARLTPLSEAMQAYDLVVVGSDPEGIAAAVSGARNGLSVLLVDSRPELGGLMTQGWLNSLDMNYSSAGDILNKGIFLEFFEQIKGDSFDVEEARWVFNKLVGDEQNIHVMAEVDDIAPVTAPQYGRTVIDGVRITLCGQSITVAARSVIDATQDGDIAALAGVTYSAGQQDIGRQASYMAVTQVFKLNGVGLSDWLRIIYNLRYDGKKFTGANWHSAWGFSDITARYEPSHDGVALRGLNIGRQGDGSLLVNALLVYGVDPLDDVSRQKARAIIDAELPLVIEFLNKNVPGMKKASLGGLAPELYVRESRHIMAEYRLTIDDVLENRDFTDRIAFGSYPVDMQPSGPGLPGVIIGTPQQYAVPFRCLVPRGVDGLLVVGRAAGFDSLPHGSARTIPVGMATGQAAGAAAAMAQQKGLTFRELAADNAMMEALQNRLNQQGMELHPFHIKNELVGHWAYDGLRFIRSLGLVAGGYNNDYRLDEPIEHQRFLNILSRAVHQLGAQVPGQPILYPEANVFNIYDASHALTEYLGMNLNKEESFTYLTEVGLLNPDHNYWQDYVSSDKPLSHGVAYMMIKDFIAYVGIP